MGRHHIVVFALGATVACAVGESRRLDRDNPLGFSPSQIDCLVAFLEVLNGEGDQDQPPGYFPR